MASRRVVSRPVLRRSLRSQRIYAREPTGAAYQARAALVGAHAAPSDEDQWKIEQALHALRSTEPLAEAAARRAVGTTKSWVVPQDRTYGRLLVIDRATPSRSWNVDLGDGKIVHLAAGADLAGAVLDVEGRDNDVLVLVDLASQRVTFRYQAS
jgi:hypothetical protein